MGGGSTSYPYLFWVNKNNKYLFEIKNNSGEAITFNIKTLIFEV